MNSVPEKEPMTTVQEEWLRVIAHAWKNEKFMKDLREDPKTTLEKGDVRRDLSLNNILGDSDGGYLPLPEIPEQAPDDLREKTEKEIVEFLKGTGKVKELFGKMQWCTCR